jgi:hypothetical protein
MAEIAQSYPSTADRRIENNTLRHQYRTLSEEEKLRMQQVKDVGQTFLDLITEIGNSRELSLSKTKTEEAVFWAVKHITK